MKKKVPHNVYSKEAKILVSDHAELGMAEFRNVFTRNNGFYYGLENYNRLAYNSSLPWQSDGKNGEVAMSYVVLSVPAGEGNSDAKWLQINTYHGVGLNDEGWFCRTAEMQDDKTVTISLAEKVTANGVVRADTIKTKGPRKVRMGFYALPELDKPISATQTKVKGKKAITIDNGKYRLTTVLSDGWDDIEVVRCHHLHPEADNSTVVNLTATVDGDKVLQSQLIMQRSK